MHSCPGRREPCSTLDAVAVISGNTKRTVTFIHIQTRAQPPTLKNWQKCRHQTKRWCACTNLRDMGKDMSAEGSIASSWHGHGD